MRAGLRTGWDLMPITIKSLVCCNKESKANSYATEGKW